MLKTLFRLFPILLLAACAQEERLPMAPIDFAREGAIPLAVANVEIVDEYVPPQKLPHVEHAAPVPPYKAVRAWADERLKAMGGTGYMRVGIKDASIVEKSLIGQLQYNGRLDVTFDASSGGKTGTGEVVVNRQVTVDSDKDLAQKERVWNDLTQQMMTEFDQSATQIINQNLGQFRAEQ